MTPNILLREGDTQISLLGAPDEDIGNPKPKVKTGQAFQIELARETVKEMQRHKQAGKGPLQLSFGKTPVLRFGSISKALHTTPASFRRELYQKEAKGDQNLQFRSLITHIIAVRRPEEVTEASDIAVARLQATMASLQKEKEENRATFIDDVKEPKKMTNGGRKANVFLKKPGLFHSVPRSLPPSPALNASHASSTTLAPTSQPASQPQAFRHTLLHFLAIRPATEQVVLKTTKIPKDKCLDQLQKFAAQQNPGKEWKLSDRWYKELDVWKFPYASQDDRQQAIDSAVRAFDRLRLSREDRLWQLLLPKEERGKGKILSKLNLHSGAVNIPPSSSKPEVTTDHASDTPKPFNHRALLAGAGGEPMARTKSLDSMAWKGKPSEADLRTKRLLSGKGSKPIPPKSKAKKEEEKASTAASPKSAPQGKPAQKRRTSLQEKSTQFVDEDEDSGLEEMLAVAPSDSANTKPREKTVRGRAKTMELNIVAGQKRKAEGKFKSAEIVHDSDEEDDESDPKVAENDVKRPRNNDTVAKPVSPRPAVIAAVSPASKPQRREVGSKSQTKTPSSQVQGPGNPDVDQARSTPKQTSRDMKTTTGTPKSAAAAGVKSSDAGPSRNTNGLPKKKELDRKAAPTPSSTSEKTTSNGIETSKPATVASSVAKAKLDPVPLKQQSKQVPGSKEANAWKGATNATEEDQTIRHPAGPAQSHKRAESTTNSSINSWVSSVSGKSTPMRRQSSSQSSTISIPTSSMPNMKKRPADTSTNEMLLSLKKRKMETSLHKPSPPMSSSPLTNASDLQSISSPSVGPRSEDASPASEGGSDKPQTPEVPQPGPGINMQPQHGGDKELGVEIAKNKARGEDTTLMDGVEVDAATRAVILERLKGQHRTMFASWIKLRIELDKIKPNIPEDKKQASWAACDHLEDLKQTIARLGFATGEYEHSSGVPKGFKLDQESEDYLKEKVTNLTKDYNKLRDELEGMESRPKDKVEEVRTMYGEARGLRMILYPEN